MLFLVRWRHISTSAFSAVTVKVGHWALFCRLPPFFPGSGNLCYQEWNHFRSAGLAADRKGKKKAGSKVGSESLSFGFWSFHHERRRRLGTERDGDEVNTTASKSEGNKEREGL